MSEPQHGAKDRANAPGSQTGREVRGFSWAKRPSQEGQSALPEDVELPCAVRLGRPGSEGDHMSDLRYPIGRFAADPDVTEEKRRRWIGEIANTPDSLRGAVDGLSAEPLDTPYRSGGWTVRQVVHHLPDSHLNAYVRFRLALTEREPTIKPYDEAAWAELADARTAPVGISLALLEALHRRWTLLLRSLSPADFPRAFRHPELGTVMLDTYLQMYAWHGRHHVAHITSLRERMGWT